MLFVCTHMYFNGVFSISFRSDAACAALSVCGVYELPLMLRKIFEVEVQLKTSLRITRVLLGSHTSHTPYMYIPQWL